MNDDFLPPASTGAEPATTPRGEQTLGSSTIYRLCEEVIQLREKNDRQHKLFDQTLTKVRSDLQASFNSFAADTQRAYQQLRQEIQGEKKFSLTLLMMLLEFYQDLEHIMNNRPADLANAEAVAGWAESVAVQTRKVQAALQQLGIKEYDADLGAPYNPALHERVGSMRKEGMGPLLVAEQRERGYASQQPDFKLVRAKVIVSE
jgi:molecular chaperone GrpE (heat shock protein)